MVGVLAVGVGGNAPADTVSPGESPAGGVGDGSDDRQWDPVNGWQDLHAVPADPPTPAWDLAVDDGMNATYWADADIVVDARRANGAVAVERIDIATGEPMWSVSVDLNGPLNLGLTPGNSAVVVEADTPAFDVELAILDITDGRLIWQGPSDVGWTSATDDLVIVEGLAIDRASGDERWRYDYYNVTVRDGAVLAEVDNDIGDITDNYFAVLDPATGQERWRAPQPLFSDLHVIGKTVIVTYDNLDRPDEATAFDLATGAEQWRVELPPVGRAHVTPISDDLALVSAGGGVGDPGVAVLDVTTGAVVWQSSVDTEFSVGMELGGIPYIIVEDDDGYVVRDGTTGDRVTELELDEVNPVQGGVMGRDGDDVVMVGLPDGAEQWRITVSSDESFDDPIPGGFLTYRPDDEAYVLSGYLGRDG